MKALVPLGEICRPKQWKTLSKAEMAKVGFPVYGANGKIGFADEYTHEKPTILVGCRGSCGTVTITEPKSYANGNAMALDDLDERRADIRYVFHYLSFRGFGDVTTGSSQPQIIGQNLRRVEIPMPPLTEQRRVAAILDKVDALRTKRRETIAKLDQLLQSVFLDMFGDPVSNPKGWSVSTIGNECEIGTGGTPSRADDLNFCGDIPWVKSTEVDWGRVTKTGEHVSEAGIKAARLKLYSPETVVVALYGQGVTRGKCAVLGIRAAMNQACAAITPSETVGTSFLLHFLKISYSRLRDEGRGGNQENLNLGILKSFAIPVPPMDLQWRFHSLVASLAELRNKQVAGQEAMSDLFSSLQQRAFAGAL